MEDVYSVWQIGIIALVAGALIGALAYHLLAPTVKQANKIKSELEQTREEMSQYKTSVSSHFKKTSELVNDLTQNYVKVYQHLAVGAQTLGDSKTFDNLLEQHQGKVLINMEDETEAPETVADTAITDSAEMKPAPAEAVGEHAEPFVDAKSDAPESDNVEAVEQQPTSVQTGVEADDKVSPGEPVLDIRKIEEVAEQVKSDLSAVADSTVAESKDKPEARPVTH